MKNLALVSIAIIINIATYAQEIVTNGEISDVIVYLQGASITTKSKTQIPEGVSTVVITKQPQSIEPQSIQVSGKGNFTILGVQFRTNYLEKQQQEKQVLELSEKRKLIDNTLKLATEEINVYKTETQLLEKNMEIKGANAVLVTSELEKTANFYRSRLLDIKKKIIEAQNKQTDLQTQLKDIDKQLYEIKAKAEQYIGEIVVTVSSKTQQTIQLESNYYVNDAGWVPQYDIRVKDVQSPVALTYKASIYQNTGISWKNIQVRLSTGNPTLSGNVAILSPWILQREQEF
ncbi:MAG TPA: mucoidy inhibitor MuiA family protein, partial [Bacteroidales bacterium]|nr:mucoidy inhibitor MuiA family protein [Bacteroidales bacterium]